MANWTFYDNHRLRQHNGSAVNFGAAGDTLKIMLCTSAYTPNQATHATKADVTGEISGGGYTARGMALTGKTLTLAAGTVTFDTNDQTYPQNASGFTTARFPVLYKDTGTDSTSGLVAFADLGGNKGNVDGDLVLQMDAAGIWTTP